MYRSVAMTDHVHFGEQYLLFKQVRDRLVIEEVYLDWVLQVGKWLNEDPLLWNNQGMSMTEAVLKDDTTQQTGQHGGRRYTAIGPTRDPR